MKTLLKVYATSTLSLYLASVAFDGIVLAKWPESLLLAGLGLSLLSLLVKPLRLGLNTTNGFILFLEPCTCIGQSAWLPQQFHLL